MSQRIEGRLVEALSAVAGQTASTGDWEQMVADARLPKQQPRRAGKGRLALAAMAIVLVFAVSGLEVRSALDDGETTAATGSRYVLPGEVIVSQDPLVVVSAPGPSPEFDTSQLGTEIELEIVDTVDDEITDLIDFASEASGSPGASMTKVTLVGRVEGLPWIITVSDGPNTEEIGGGDPLGNFRTWAVAGPGGLSGSGDPVPVGSLEMIALPIEHDPSRPVVPSYSSPTGWMEWGPLPANVAVATFADSEERLWMRPRAGTVVFPVELDSGDSFTLQTFTASGELTTTYTETVEG